MSQFAIFALLMASTWAYVVIYIGCDSIVAHVYCAGSFWTLFFRLYGCISVYHFSSSFQSSVSVCHVFFFVVVALRLSLGRCRCVFTAMKRDLSSCICCILALAMPYSLFRYTIFSSTPVFAFMFECEKCIVNNRHLTFISSDGILRCNEIQ